MGAPVATSADLATYLDTAVDDPRMTALLEYAQDRLEAIKTPCPVAAKGIVVAIAARAYSNPSSATQLGIGTGHVGLATTALGGIGGLYVSKDERASYRSMTGGTGAFSVDTMPVGLDEIQTLTVSATAGTFTLTFMGVTTAPIPYSANASDVQAALQAIPPVGVGNVSVTGAFTIEFVGDLAARPLQLITVDGTNLTGSASVLRTQAGVWAPGENLAPWNKQYGYYPSLGWGWL